MKVKLSLLLVLVMVLSLFGFDPVNAEAAGIELKVLDRSEIKVTAELKKPDISSTGIKNLKDSDPDQMVRVIVELESESVIETANIK